MNKKPCKFNCKECKYCAVELSKKGLYFCYECKKHGLLATHYNEFKSTYLFENDLIETEKGLLRV